jgi:hypothetical protein
MDALEQDLSGNPTLTAASFARSRPSFAAGFRAERLAEPERERLMGVE